ncbi:MAG: hypothetical protein U0T73_09660 [Chitinophagales bacterium]
MKKTLLSGKWDGEKIEAMARSRFLDIQMKGTLRTLPGSVHWHFKRKKEGGIFEVTLLTNGSAEVSFHDNRHALWVTEEMDFWAQL